MSTDVSTVPSAPSFDRQFDLLKLELTLIDNAIRSLDEITKNVKQWAILGWGASVGLALGDSTLKPAIWLTVFLPVAFWLLDGSYRRVQRTFIVRNRHIADFINDKKFLEAAQSGQGFDFQLMRMRKKEGRKTSWFTVMTFWTVAPIYILMMLGSIAISTLVGMGRM
jgi:hypothetical protein